MKRMFDPAQYCLRTTFSPHQCPRTGQELRWSVLIITTPSTPVSSQAEKRISVTWVCQNQMFREEKESTDDIRLSIRLYSKCLADSQKFCASVEPGHMRMQECLEDNMDDSNFSSECKEELTNVISKRANNFQLDVALREACEVSVSRSEGSSEAHSQGGDDSFRLSGRG